MKRCIFFAFILFAGIAAAQQTTTATVEEYLAKGDAAFDSFDNQTALNNYQRAHNIDPDNCEAMWKISRGHIDLGEVADKTLKKQHYFLGEKFARMAVEKCQNNSDAHLSLAIAVGRVALLEGGKKKVELSNEVKTEAEKALELDPNKDIAHHVLARWHREVASLSGILKAFAKVLYGGLPPADKETAVEHFNKAIEINPNYINHHLELGITFESLKEWQLAKTEYEKIAELPSTEFDDQDHKTTAQERLKKVLKKLK